MDGKSTENSTKPQFIQQWVGMGSRQEERGMDGKSFEEWPNKKTQRPLTQPEPVCAVVSAKSVSCNSSTINQHASFPASYPCQTSATGQPLLLSSLSLFRFLPISVARSVPLSIFSSLPVHVSVSVPFSFSSLSPSVLLSLRNPMLCRMNGRIGLIQ